MLEINQVTDNVVPDLLSAASKREASPIARLLAQFDLYAEVVQENEGAFARLYGATFPHSPLLDAAGAIWDKPSQSWIFCNEATLQCFANSLDQTCKSDLVGLKEESSSFIGADNLQNPLNRFLALGANALCDETLLELILSFDQYLESPSATSRQLFAEFGSFGAILSCESFRLKKLEGITPRVVGLLKAIQLTMERVLHEPLRENPVIGSWQALLDYLSGLLRHRQREALLVLYLDKRNRLIKTDITEGTIDNVALYPREVVTRALELVAGAVIVAHNHPGGNTEPSNADCATTREVCIALKALGIELYDHVIISDKSHFSFRAENLI